MVSMGLMLKTDTPRETTKEKTIQGYQPRVDEKGLLKYRPYWTVGDEWQSDYSNLENHLLIRPFEKHTNPKIRIKTKNGWVNIQSGDMEKQPYAQQFRLNVMLK